MISLMTSKDKQKEWNQVINITFNRNCNAFIFNLDNIDQFKE